MNNFLTCFVILLLFMPTARWGQEGKEPPVITLSARESSDMEARRLADAAKSSSNGFAAFRLSPAEETWLKDYPTIRVGMSPVIPPLKSTDQGVNKGIKPDHLKVLSEYTG